MTPLNPFNSYPSDPFQGSEFSFEENPSGLSCKIEGNDTVVIDGVTMSVDDFVKFGDGHFPDSTAAQRVNKVLTTALWGGAQWFGPCVSPSLSDDLKKIADPYSWDVDETLSFEEIQKAEIRNRRVQITPFGKNYIVSENCLLEGLEHLLRFDFGFFSEECREEPLKAGTYRDRVGKEILDPGKLVPSSHGAWIFLY